MENSENIPESDEEELSEPMSLEESEYKEKWHRAIADLENMRKRHEQDRASLSKYSLEKFIEELLPVVDNFYRASEHIPADQAKSPWVIGIQYIQKNLLDVLESKGVKEIPAKTGDKFDASKHEAIQNEETTDKKLDQTITIINRGYMLHDRVIRPVQVAVYAYNQK